MRKSSPPRLRLDALPTRELIARGQDLLSARNYKDAIDIYKLLLKREPQGEAGWRESLATAYLERAWQLAEKAMYREAAVIWENLPNLCGQAPHPDWYVDWLLQSGQYAKAMRAYAEHATDLTGVSELETRLAALALAGQKDILQSLPQEMPLRRQLTVAQAAVRAYGQGAAESVVREHLQSISIRSPYRDLRQALSALLKLETDSEDAAAFIERIAITSPYHGLAEIVRACVAPEPAPALLALDPAQRELAAHLLGMDARQLKLLKEWAKLGAPPDPKALFGFIMTNLALMDQEQARRACLALLSVYPRGQPIYTQRFGPLPPLETQRLQALHAEREQDDHRALRHWQACVDELVKDRNNPDHPLMIALVLRHMAELAKHGDFGWGHNPEPADYLEKSLEFDPEDRDAYLQLAQLHKEDNNEKRYHQVVEHGVKQFPDDPQVLMAAVATATARKAYKKAAGFAARVLELDPINTKARTVLINSHLAHARKQIQAGKYALAEKELNSASQLERDNARSGIVEINRGLMAFRQRQPESMKQWLQEGVRLAGNPFLGWLRLAAETTRLNLEPTFFQHDLALGDPRKFTANRGDLMTLTQWVNAYREEGFEDISSVLEDLEKPLKKAIRKLSNEEDWISICECMHETLHYELLEYAATQALEQHPGRPLFVYYQIYGRAEGDMEEVRDRDFDRLESAFETAKEAEDKRSVMRIGRFLSESQPPMPFGRPGSGPRSMPMPMNMPSSVREEMAEIREQLEQLPPALRDQMLDRILDDMPKDGDFPPEVQRALMKAMILGNNPLQKLLDMDMDFDMDDDDDFPPPPRGRGRPKKRRR
jgi:tetratricopeptide (TPR) repeat protein